LITKGVIRMEIVIDIPEEDYLKLIKTDENGEKEIPLGLLLSLWDSVKYKCTPLYRKEV
jgi:hypothetical protein